MDYDLLKRVGQNQAQEKWNQASNMWDDDYANESTESTKEEYKSINDILNMPYKPQKKGNGLGMMNYNNRPMLGEITQLNGGQSNPSRGRIRAEKPRKRSTRKKR